MKWMVTTLIVLAIAGGIGWKVYSKLYAVGAPIEKKETVAVAVEVAPVHQATIHDIALFSGDLAARNEFIVAPKVAGRLVKLLADIGDTIQNGDPIAELDDGEYAQQVEQAKAELDVSKASVDEARSNLDAAQNEFDRVQALRSKKIASESELDESRSQFRTAQARHRVALAVVAQKEASLKAAQVRLSYTKIAASWSDGAQTRMIGERFANAGAMLAANDKIVQVIDIADLTAVLYVTERDYGKVQVGQTVEIFCDAYTKPFIGKIVRVAPLVKETSREARVEVDVDNHERLLRPGMFVRARIELASHEDATVIPQAALAMWAGKQGVFVADLASRTVRFVPVTVGVIEGDLAQVREPAHLQGYVVTLGQHLLEEGSTIVIPDRKTSPVSSQPVRAASASQNSGASS